MRRVIHRHWHQHLCSSVSRCCWWLLLVLLSHQHSSTATSHIQDIRKIRREHIFSNLFTKTELLIAPCWLAIASEGHIPRCVASKSWTEGHFQWLLIVCWWIRGEARPEDYVNGFHLCFTVVSQNWIINGWGVCIMCGRQGMLTSRVAF